MDSLVDNLFFLVSIFCEIMEKHFCIKTDNTLWAWGNGGSGALGLGSFTYYSSPKQVGSATWLKVSTGGSYKTLGIEL
jgi:hypothetical protein